MTGDYGHLSAAEIWRISRIAEANAPVWSRQAWGAWRLGNSLDVKNREMSETGRFGFDAADARGHLGDALGTAVTKIRSRMAGYAGTASELKAAMERVSHSRGTTHTELERLWAEYEAAPDEAGRGEIEKRMRLAHGRFTDGYLREADGVKGFEPYTGVRKPVDGGGRNTDRLGGDSTGGGTPAGSGRDTPTGHRTGTDRTHPATTEPTGPDLQATTTPSATAPTAPSAAPTTVHTPAQPTVAPVIGARPPGGPAFTTPPPPRPNPTGLSSPVNHGARPAPGARPATGTTPPNPATRPTPAPKAAGTPARRPAPDTPPRFRREGGIRAPILPDGKPKRGKQKPKDAERPSSGDGETTFWTPSTGVVPGVIGSRAQTAEQSRRGSGAEHDPGRLAGRDGMRPRAVRVHFDLEEE